MSVAWLLEVNLRHIAGTGSYGVLLQSETGTSVSITIISGSRLAVCSSVSAAEPIQTLSLLPAFITTAWHQLIISLSGSVLSVQFDYLHPLEVIIDHPINTFSLLAQQCSAAFSGISLTDHFRDEFLSNWPTPALLGWNVETGLDWHVHDGALEQTSDAVGEYIVLKDTLYEHYECGATMQLHRANQHGQPALGLVAWHSTREKFFIWFMNTQAHWALVIESSDSTSKANVTFDLPETFDPCNWHTLRFRRWCNQLTIYLDGPEILTIPMPSRLEKLGLVTRDAAIAFTGVWQTALPLG